jgi:hypothetical protein
MESTKIRSCDLPRTRNLRAPLGSVAEHAGFERKEGAHLGGLGWRQTEEEHRKYTTDSVDVVGRWEERRGPRGRGSGGGGGIGGDLRLVTIPPPKDVKVLFLKKNKSSYCGVELLRHKAIAL